MSMSVVFASILTSIFCIGVSIYMALAFYKTIKDEFFPEKKNNFDRGQNEYYKELSEIVTKKKLNK